VTGRTWNFDAGVWTVDTNKAKGSPVAGSELVVNGNFSAWTGDDPDGWAVIGEVGADPEVSEVGTGEGHGGVGTGMCNLYTSTSANLFIQPSVAILSTGTWYSVSVTIDTVISSGIKLGAHLPLPSIVWATIGTKRMTGRALGTAFQVIRSGMTDVTFDDVSVKALTFSELFASVDDAATSDVVISADVTLTADTQVGIVMNLDDESNPQNFVIAYHDGTNAKLEKCVAGTYTTVISAAATYSASATLVVIKDGNDYSLYYNNDKIGSTSTISDVGIVSNTKHGLFSTFADNRLDNFTVFPRGTGGEYSDLDNY